MRNMIARAPSSVISSATVRASSARKRQCPGLFLYGIRSAGVHAVHLRGLRVARRPLGRDVSEGASSADLAWLDRLAVILSVNAWSVVAASVHSRANLRYSSRRRRSTVNSAARTQLSAWYFIKLLQCRQILCVIALIMLLQCRYQFRLFS